MIRKGNEVVVYADDGKTERFRCTVPEDMTLDDVEKFREHMLKQIAAKEAGPS